jgi:7,8-dihydroneopterin aldolase/epimerase/oxygenase
MGKVALKGMEFYAHHGWYVEENKLGNRYEVDFTAWLTNGFSKAASENDLNATINYEVIYSTVQQVMAVPTPLLETIAQNINNALAQEFPFAEHFECTIRKYNPPVGGLCHYAEITLEHLL